MRDLAAKELAGVSSQLSQLASTSNRAAIAEAALKDSQQIVSRQHDALEQTSERLRLNDQQLDLMRNALHRRDELLGSQRAAFYKELLRFQAFAEHEATHARPPASEYARSTSPAFFDACVFEALHLTADEPLVQKAAKALQVAVKQQGVLSEEADAAAKAAAEELRLAQRAADEREAELKAELDASYATMAARAEQIARAKEAELREGHEAEVNAQGEARRRDEGGGGRARGGDGARGGGGGGARGRDESAARVALCGGDARGGGGTRGAAWRRRRRPPRPRKACAMTSTMSVPARGGGVGAAAARAEEDGGA